MSGTVLQWQESNPEKTGVQHMNDLQARITAQDAAGEHYLFAQGAETVMCEGLDLSFSDGPSYAYNKATVLGGAPEDRAATAKFLLDFIGLPADQTNTFLASTNGRALIALALEVISDEANENGFISIMPVPETLWPMIIEQARDKHIRVIPYDSSDERMIESLREQIAKIPATINGRSTKLIGIYAPLGLHNPSSTKASAETMHGLMQLSEELNVPVVLDGPYFHGSKQKNEPPFLCAGGETGALLNYPNAQFLAVTSFSKALGTAKGGFSSITCSHPKLVNAVSRRLANTIGFSFFPNYFAKLRAALNPENYPVLRNHFSCLRKPYEVNRQIVEEALAPFGRFVQGEPGMTGLFEFYPEVFGKEFLCFDGQTRTTDNVRKLAEIAANELHVYFVDNTVKPGTFIIPSNSEGKNYARFTFADKSAEHVKKGIRALAGLLATLAPELAPAPSEKTALAEEFNGPGGMS